MAIQIQAGQRLGLGLLGILLCLRRLSPDTHLIIKRCFGNNRLTDLLCGVWLCGGMSIAWGVVVWALWCGGMGIVWGVVVWALYGVGRGRTFEF